MDQTPQTPPASPIPPAPPTPTPNPNPAPAMNMAPQGASSLGAIIAGIVILAVLAFGALYFMGEKRESEALNDELNAINAQSDSDAEAAIEADLNATDVDSVDYDLNEENFNAS